MFAGHFTTALLAKQQVRRGHIAYFLIASQLPDLLWLPVAVAALVGRVGFGSWRVGLAGSALVAAHSLIDNLAGYPHHLFGPDSVDVSTGMYAWSPYLAVGVEAAFIVATLAWVIRTDRQAGVRRTLATWLVRVAVFVGGVAFMFSVADLSLAEVAGIEPLALLAGTTMPIMTVLYVAMVLALGWGESRPSLEAATIGDSAPRGRRPRRS